MAVQEENTRRGTLMGAVYGDLIGSPYMIENTYNKYFDLGETRHAYSHGRVRAFFPEVTEASHSCAAVSRWLSVQRDSPTAEGLIVALQDAYAHHPKGGWTEATRLFLTGGHRVPSRTPDWAAVVRAVALAPFAGDDRERAMSLSEACVRATCDNDQAVDMARAVCSAALMGLQGRGPLEVLGMLEKEFGLGMEMSEDDLRSELRGEVRQPLVMMGVPVKGAYRYVVPEVPSSVSARAVTAAALRAVMTSDSWEDAVRKAVAYGGPSNAVAAIAGGVAEAFYGEVTPSVVGKLFSHVPTDIASQMDSLYRRGAVRVRSAGSPYTSMERDAVTIVTLAPGRTVYVVPEQRNDIRSLVSAKVPKPDFIPPEKLEEFLKGYEEKREGTFAYGIRPEVRTLYVQDARRLVSPSQYIAPGMPPLQERMRHLKEFLGLRSWCVDCQNTLNRLAGNEGAGQIHYGGAYHLWIGSRRIDFLMGDQLCGRISLDGRGLLKVELGELTSVGADSRFENHREQAWAAQGIFSRADTVSPIERLQQIREEIAYRLLDEGNGGERHELDTRYLSDAERAERYGVSNVDHLEKLDFGEKTGLAPDGRRDGGIAGSEAPVEEAKQPTDMIYSIGYGARTQEGFINTLRMSGIDTVVDVRSIPRSKYVPHFNEDVIYDALSGQGIDYFSAGERLGGRITAPSLLEGGRVSWEKTAEDGDYLSAVASLEKLCAEGHVVAVVCSEGDPLSCHRFGLLSRTLSGDGMNVRHILPNGEVVNHEEMETRLIGKYERKNLIPSVCTGSYKVQLEEAYKAMNEEYGYKPGKSLSHTGFHHRMKR